MTQAAAVAALLPDEPRWIGARGLLLSGRGGLVGPADPSAPAFVVLRPDTGIAAVVGRPPASTIRDAAAQAHTVLAVPEDQAWVRAALPAWAQEPAVLHVLPPGWKAPAARPSDCVRLLEPGELGALDHVPADVVHELELAAGLGASIGAAFHQGKAVSFCAAFCATEGLWDVSIDTVESHRRRGFAAAVAAFMIGFHASEGRRPVWGSAESNPASARLAIKLGLVAADTICVFTPA